MRAAAAWPGRRSIALAVGALVVAATVWWFTGREVLPGAAPRESLAASAAAPTAPIAGAVRGASGASVAHAAALPPPPVAPYPATGAPGISTDDPLTAYRRANVYPPTSRPLSKDQDDLLKPGRRHE